MGELELDWNDGIAGPGEWLGPDGKGGPIYDEAGGVAYDDAGCGDAGPPTSTWDTLDETLSVIGP